MPAIASATTPATKSAIGPAYMMPSMPINSGRITINGSKKRIWRVRDRKIPFFGYPIAVNRFDAIGCTQCKNVKNR